MHLIISHQTLKKFREQFFRNLQTKSKIKHYYSTNAIAGFMHPPVTNEETIDKQFLKQSWQNLAISLIKLQFFLKISGNFSDKILKCNRFRTFIKRTTYYFSFSCWRDFLLLILITQTFLTKISFEIFFSNAYYRCIKVHNAN